MSAVARPEHYERAAHGPPMESRFRQRSMPSKCNARPAVDEFDIAQSRQRRRRCPRHRIEETPKRNIASRAITARHHDARYR